MAQQNIDYGNFPDDPNADDIRTAFKKIQNNFDELYTSGSGNGVTQINPGSGITVDNTTGNVTVTARINRVSIASNTLTVVNSPLVSGQSNIQLEIPSASNADITFNGNITFSNVSNVHIAGGNANQFLQTNGSGNLTWANTPLTPPATTSTGTSGFQIQFNDGGVFGGSNAFTFDPIANTLTVPQIQITNSSNTSLGSVGNLHITGGSNGQALLTDGLGNLRWGNAYAIPGGSNSEIQFNYSGNLGGDPRFTFNAVTGNLTAPYFSGNGTYLANIPGSAIVGTISGANAAYALNSANANFATYSGTANFSNIATLANTVANAPWSNITGIPASLAALANSSSNAVLVSDKGVANGVVPLDSTGKIDSSYLPPVSTVGNIYTVTTSADLVTLSGAIPGDMAIATSQSLTFILSTSPPTDINNWTQLLTPGSPVTSVNGQIGTVNLNAANVGALPNTSVLLAGDGVTLSPSTGNLAGGNITISVASGTANAANTIPLRDASGGFTVGYLNTNTLTVVANSSISSLGVGTSASGTPGEIRAVNNITAYYSDDRLKTRLGDIEDALNKVKQLKGFYYEANDAAVALGYTRKREVGVSAQDVQAVLPEIVTTAPISDHYLTIYYDKLVPLLIEAVKELSTRVEQLEQQKQAPQQGS